MKTDNELSDLLKTWQVEDCPSPDFRRNVWARIHERENVTAKSGVLATLREWFARTMPSPAGIVAATTLFIATGSAIAGVSAVQLNDEQNSSAKQRYLVTIDPLAKAQSHVSRSTQP